MERYKGYRVPLTFVKSGTLLKKLAARGQKSSDAILHSIIKPDSQDPKAVGPLTSTEELLEALDIAIGSEGENLEGHEHGEPISVPTEVEIKDGDEAPVHTPRRRRRTRVEMEAAAAGNPEYEEPRFVELTKLLPSVPKKGTFEVNAVKKSLYFFS